MASRRSIENQPDDEYMKNHDRLLMKFVLDETRNETDPFAVTELADLFKLKNGSVLSKKYCWMRIRKLCSNAHLIEDCTIRQAIKIAFLTSSPISEEFKAEIEKEAEVKLDGKKRIIKCRSHSNFMLEYYRFKGDHKNIEWRAKTLQQRKREEEETPAIWRELLADRAKELARINGTTATTAPSLPAPGSSTRRTKRRHRSIEEDVQFIGTSSSSRPILMDTTNTCRVADWPNLRKVETTVVIDENGEELICID